MGSESGTVNPTSSTTRGPRAGLLGALSPLLCVLVWLLMAAHTAHAYSSFGDYTRSIEEGGGGGRLFSGTPADGYGCDVCHRGAEGATLEVAGLPLDGYVPGRAYELTFLWPPTAPHVALMAEFTDAAGRPSGTTALAPYATWQPAELCEDGAFPAADVCRLGGEASGCCRDLDPSRDACSFPGERSVLWLLDCGSRAARLVWTAPPTAAGDVWFSGGMVTSNVANDPLGDGVTLVRHRLHALGTDAQAQTITGRCSTVSLASASGPVSGSFWLLLFGLTCARRFRRRRSVRACTTARQANAVLCQNPNQSGQ